MLAVLLTCGSQAVIQTQEGRKFDQQEVEDPFFRFGNVGELPVTQSSFFETNEACFLSSLPHTTHGNNSFEKTLHEKIFAVEDNFLMWLTRYKTSL